MRGDGKKKEQGPPINATSKDEEAFIKFVQPALHPHLQWLVGD
jgi:hypothetical protein